jgi:hypothetical protein
VSDEKTEMSGPPSAAPKSAPRKSGAEKAIDRKEARARADLIDALMAWEPWRRAQHEVADITDTVEDIDAAVDLRARLLARDKEAM